MSGKKSKPCNPNLIRRSMSLTALNHLSSETIEPRMQRLETLEAKMANIAHALSCEDRLSILGKQCPSPTRMFSTISDFPLARKKRQITSYNIYNRRISHQDNRWQRLNCSREEQREINKQTDLLMSKLRNESQQITDSNNNKVNSSASAATEEALRTSLAIEEKKTSVKNLKQSLALSVTDDNIDSQISRAELEFKLGTEEIALMELQQKYLENISDRLLDYEKQNLLTKSRENGAVSFYKLVIASDSNYRSATSLHSVDIHARDVHVQQYRNQLGYHDDDVVYCDDVIEPTSCSLSSSEFNVIVKQRNNNKGLVIESVNKNIDLKKGDRIIEINGYNVMNGTNQDYNDIVKSSSTSLLRIVVLRTQSKTKRFKDPEVMKQELSMVASKLEYRIKENREMQNKFEKLMKEKCNLERDNQRQRHRISFLEDRLEQMMVSWNDLRLALDQQLMDSIGIQNNVAEDLRNENSSSMEQ